MMDDQKLEPVPKGGDDGGSFRSIAESPARNIEDNVDRFSIDTTPMRAWGVKSRMCPPYPQRDRMY